MNDELKKYEDSTLESDQVKEENKVIDNSEKSQLTFEQIRANWGEVDPNFKEKNKKNQQIDFSQNGSSNNNSLNKGPVPSGIRITLPKVTSKEDAMRIFFGRNFGYYERYYRKFRETGKKVSWNWCSFLFSPMWFFSRKMYLFGGLLAFISSVLQLGNTMLYQYIDDPRMSALLLPWSLLNLIFFIALGMFGNYLYITHMEKKIRYPGEEGLNEEQVAQINFMHGGLTLNGIITGYLIMSLVSMLLTSLFPVM